MKTNAAVRSIAYVLVLAILTTPMVGFRACKKVTPSSQVEIGRGFVSLAIAAKATKDITFALVNDNALTVDGRRKAIVVLDKIMATADQIAGDVQAGRFDAAAWDVALSNLATEWTAIAAILATNIDPRVNEWVSLVQYLVPLIKSLVDQLKPAPAPAIPIITAEGKAKAKVTPGGIAAIAAISVGAAIRYLDAQRDDSLDSLWAKYHKYSIEYHAAPSLRR